MFLYECLANSINFESGYSKNADFLKTLYGMLNTYQFIRHQLTTPFLYEILSRNNGPATAFSSANKVSPNKEYCAKYVSYIMLSTSKR